MWLAEKAAQGGREAGRTVDIGVVTQGGDKPSVMLEGEKRQVEVLTPQGVLWRPRVGQQVLVLCCDGEYFAAGTLGAAGAASLKDGEVFIHCGGASVHVRADGGIELTGEVNVSGNLYLNGINILAYMI